MNRKAGDRSGPDGQVAGSRCRHSSRRFTHPCHIFRDGLLVKSIALLLLAECLLQATTASAQTPSSTLKKLADTQEISLGVREQTVPFAYLDADQQFVGYSVDICKGVVEELRKRPGLEGLKIKYVPVAAATRIPLLANGTIDLECASTTNNAARQKQVAFSDTIFLTSSTFVSKKAKNLKTTDDLKGRVVTSTSGTSNLVDLNEANVKRSLGMRVVPTKDVTEGFLMVSMDRADAFAMDDVVLVGLIANTRDADQYVISSDAFAPPEPYALAMRKDDIEFKKVVDDALTRFFGSPAGPSNYSKWFEQPIPPNGIVLKFPMGAALRRAYQSPTDSIDPATYK
jgi:glutamate/aspartate transport system substrate-binding protein